MKLIVKWPYVIKGEIKTYNCVINLNKITERDFNIPYLFVNLYTSFYVDKKYFDIDFLENLFDEYLKGAYSLFKTNVFSKICKISELISYIPFLILKNIRNKHFYNEIAAFNDGYYQKYLDEYILNYHNLFKCYCNF